jgi:pyridoxal phosphate enzyme (YggS family)
MNAPDRLAENLRRVRARIAAACARRGRDPNQIDLIVVTKGVSAELVSLLPSLDVRIVGENRVQEAAAKIPEINGLRWHMVGSLQTNKAKKASTLFEAIHSLDRIELAEALLAPIQAFIEVNVAGEATKRGLSPETAPGFVETVRRRFPHISLLGLMTMAPWSEDAERSRPIFRTLSALARRCGLSSTSMGMSQDFEVAIEEGATHIRVGSAIFEGTTQNGGTARTRRPPSGDVQ